MPLGHHMLALRCSDSCYHPHTVRGRTPCTQWKSGLEEPELAKLLVLGCLLEVQVWEEVLEAVSVSRRK